MSNQNQSSSSYSSSSFSSSSYSTSSSTDPEGHSKTYTETMTSNDRDGTNIRRVTEETGKPTVRDEKYIPAGGRPAGSGIQDAGARRVEDVSDEAAGDKDQASRDREYEERMEEEYAKREGVLDLDHSDGLGV